MHEDIFFFQFFPLKRVIEKREFSVFSPDKENIFTQFHNIFFIHTLNIREIISPFSFLFVRHMKNKKFFF